MESYKTQDIVLAAVLKMVGTDLVDIEIDGNKGTFVFANINDEFLENYHLGKTAVEPVAFNNTLKQLVTAIRSKTRG